MQTEFLGPVFRFDHVMLRVQDLERSIGFYTQHFGMQVLRRTDYPGGKFTNAFLGYAPENAATALELTWNWEREEPYAKGEAFGHLAFTVPDVRAAAAYLESRGVRIRTPPKQMAHGTRIIAFVLDPDDYLIELVEPLRSPAT